MITVRPRESLHHVEGGWFSAYWHFSFDDYIDPDNTWIGNLRVVASEASNLSMVERQLGNLDCAEALAREALAIGERIGDQFTTPFAISGLAAIAMERREFERAATLVGAAEAIMAQHMAWPPDERPHYERDAGRASRSHGEAGVRPSTCGWELDACKRGRRLRPRSSFGGIAEAATVRRPSRDPEYRASGRPNGSLRWARDIEEARARHKVTGDARNA